jgi:dihydrofolate synthase/folylpolyglutamate synthase
VIPSKVTVLTSVGLEHTEFLGSTEVEIATEKLAVLRDHTTLVTGPLAPDVEALARAVAGERNARLVTVSDLASAVQLPSAAPYLRRNFAVALAAAEVIVNRLEPERVQRVAAGLELHGRMEVIDSDPPSVLDAAHNPAGAAALAEALPAVAGGRAVIAVLAVLADKDAAAFVRALAPFVACVVATEVPPDVLAAAGRPGARALAAADLAAHAREGGVGWVEAEPDPATAVDRGRALARGQGGVLLISGSHYLLPYGE